MLSEQIKNGRGNHLVRMKSQIMFQLHAIYNEVDPLNVDFFFHQVIPLLIESHEHVLEYILKQEQS